MSDIRRSIIVLYFLCTFLFYGCHNSSIVDDSSIVLSSTSELVTENSISDIDLISNVELISLQNDSVILGDIDKIICSDSLIYILDRYQRKCIDIFSRSGDYLNTLNRFGRGRGEYTQLADFFIDKDKSTLNILDRGSNRILVFDIFGRKFIRDIELPKKFSRIKPINSGYIGYMGNYSEDKKNPFNIWVLDNNFKILKNYIKIDPLYNSRDNGNMNFLSCFSDECNIVLGNSYEVYSYSNGEMLRKYVFDFKKLNMPKLDKSELDDPVIMNKLASQYILDIYNFQETESKILAKVIYQGQYMMVVYDKHSKLMQMVYMDVFENDNYFFSFGRLIDMDENHLYSIVNAERINTMLLGHDLYNDFESLYPNQIKNLRAKLGNCVDPEGNPFLAIYNIK